MAKYECDLLGPGIQKSVLSQKKLMNLADFLNAGSDAIIFG